MSIHYDLDTVKIALAELPEKILDWAEEVLVQQAELIVGLAKIYVRVETGSLRDSIRLERGGEGMNWRRIRVRAGGYITNPKTGRLVDYARLIEHKFPFMTPALNEVKPTIAAMIKAKIVENANAL